MFSKVICHSCILHLWTLCCPLQVKYKEAGQKELSSNLFSTLPQTLHTQVAKEVTELQSQVTDRGAAAAAATATSCKPCFFCFLSFSFYTMIPSEISSLNCVQVKYRESGKKEAGSALYHLLPETADTQHAKHMSEIQSEVLAPPTQLPHPPPAQPPDSDQQR